MARYALLIGARHFDDERIKPLNAPDEDVSLFNSVLSDPNIGGFNNVELCLNEPYNSVRDKIVSLTADRDRDDLILLYYSGHGVLDFNDGLHLLTKTSNLDRLAAASFHSDDIKTFLNRSRSRRQILILDCCHAGAFIGDGYKDAGERPAVSETTFDPRGYGRIVMMSSSMVQPTPDGLPESVSPFTSFLIEGLRDGLAAPDDEEISVQALAAYAEGQMLRTMPGTTPRIHEDKQAGSIILARNMRAGSHRIPDNLRIGIDDPDPLRRGGVIARLKGLLEVSDPPLARAIRRLLDARQKEERDGDLRDELRAALRVKSRIQSANSIKGKEGQATAGLLGGSGVGKDHADGQGPDIARNFEITEYSTRNMSYISREIEYLSLKIDHLEEKYKLEKEKSDILSDDNLKIIEVKDKFELDNAHLRERNKFLSSRFEELDASIEKYKLNINSLKETNASLELRSKEMEQLINGYRKKTRKLEKEKNPWITAVFLSIIMTITILAIVEYGKSIKFVNTEKFSNPQ